MSTLALGAVVTDLLLNRSRIEVSRLCCLASSVCRTALHYAAEYVLKCVWWWWWWCCCLLLLPSLLGVFMLVAHSARVCADPQG